VFNGLREAANMGDHRFSGAVRIAAAYRLDYDGMLNNIALRHNGDLPHQPLPEVTHLTD
jgi:hypothetical protein